MQQVIQYQKSGEISVEELPAPMLKPGGILVRNAFSLISAGTERSSVMTAQASMFGKARSRPDLVRQVIDNFKREGLVATIEKVQNRLDNYKELGYSCAGRVIASSCDEFSVGDPVACGGVGFASHAEIVFVPRNLAARIPQTVSMEAAAFTTVGSIAMQGVRQADVRIGERVVVLGLGLIGLITVQILRANGCRVLGLDITDHNFELARNLGCEECAISDPGAARQVELFTRGYGADATIITAATTSNQPIELACQFARKRSRIVVVGAVGMDVPRSPFYEKELELRISCSYGPGRYDPSYEQAGNDYPIGFVRWTEKRNMESVLDLLCSGSLDFQRLVSHRIPVREALRAYDLITGNTKSGYLGILLTYPDGGEPKTSIERRAFSANSAPSAVGATPTLAFLGAGNHAQSYLLPPLKKLDVNLKFVITSKPVNAKSTAEKFSFQSFGTDPEEAFRDPAINAVFIASRHDSHGRYVIDAINSSKAVFVEKPLTITSEELDEIVDHHRAASQRGTPPIVMVGYNRRFSAAIGSLRRFFESAGEPLVMNYRINAGYLDEGSWYQAAGQGGRIVGEIGHFIDTLQFLSGEVPVSVVANAPLDKHHRYRSDNICMQIAFSGGSVGQITYVASGSPAMSKEYVEVFGGGRSASMDNFKHMILYENRKKSTESLSGDKGHAAEVAAFVDGLRKGIAPIPFESLVLTSRATFAALEALRSGSQIIL